MHALTVSLAKVAVIPDSIRFWCDRGEKGENAPTEKCAF